MGEKKFCMHCGESIDSDCIICPKCGKQVSDIKRSSDPSIVINNSSNANANATSTSFGMGISPKSKVVSLILCIFLGYFGIHRFYVGKIGTGILWLCTLGMCGIGWIYDIIKILSGTFTDGAGRIIVK